MLHNLSIKYNNPCKLRWRLEVKELSLKTKRTTHAEAKNDYDLMLLKTSHWLWNM